MLDGHHSLPIIPALRGRDGGSQSKLASQSSQIGELWVQLRDPVSRRSHGDSQHQFQAFNVCTHIKERKQSRDHPKLWSKKVAVPQSLLIHVPMIWSCLLSDIRNAHTYITVVLKLNPTKPFTFARLALMMESWGNCSGYLSLWLHIVSWKIYV